jgi:PAS domain S-box-containing protein
MRTIRTYLLLLTMVAAVPPVLFAAFVLVRLADSQIAASGRDTIELARAINVAIDERVGEQIAALEALAGSASLRAGDMATFRAELDAAAHLLQSNVSLCDLQGQELMNARLAPGETLPRRAGAPFAQEAARTGRPLVSNLYRGAISGRWVATIEVPVMADGAARFVLAATIEPAALNALIGRQRLPPELMTSVIDRNGLFVTRSRDGQARTGTSASATFVRSSAAAPEGWTRTVSVEGSQNYLAFSRSELTGWSVGIGVPVEIVLAPLRHALVPLAVAGAGLVAASLLLASRIARRIRKPVAALTRLASGGPAETGGTAGDPSGLGLREADEVGRALLATRAHEREAAARLQASEARYRALAEAQPSVMFVADPQGGATYVNRAFQELTGLPAAALLGRGWLMALHPEDRDRTAAAWEECVRTLAHYEAECRLRRADGELRCFLVRGAPALTPDGAATAWFGTATDITELVAARETLARQGDALEAEVAARTAERDRTWKLSRDLLAVIDANGRFVSVNPAFTEQLGHAEETFIGSRFIDFVHPDDRASSTALQVRAREGESLDGPENRLRCADGGWRTLSWTTRTQDGLTYCAARDVTEQRATEAALRAAEEQARQAQKLEAIGQLTGGLAHDFNNLLQVVSTNLELIDEAAGSPGATASFRRRHAAAADAVRRGAALTRQLLAFARKQPLDPRVLDPGRLLREQGELLRRTLGETIEVQAAAADDVWNVSADPNQLENAILNLAVNARDAIMSGGPQSVGRVTLEARNVLLDARYAAAHAGVEAGEYVCVAVSDSGPGMPPEVAARAFEPFFTTKPAGEGTGLGLAQVYGFAKQSGGHAALYTEPGHGTTVRLYLARAAQPAPAGDEAPAAAPETAGGDETVLVVEDDAEVQAAAVEMLDSLGYRTLRACDGASALAVLHEGAEIDLVFTDVVMPGPVSSTEMARRARELRPELAVLFTSGYTEAGAAHHGRLEPGVALLSKPYGRAELSRKLRSVLDAPSRPRSTPPNRAADEPGRGRPHTILLVEDDELVRISAAMLLESLGHAVVEAGTGAQALAMLESEPAIDVLMTDLGLPDINGADVVERAWAARPRLMVVVATGRAATDVADGAAALQKPYDLRQMAAALARAEALAAARAD